MSLEGLHLAQYHLLRMVGSGGMGEVYLAEDARIGQRVAIKVCKTEAAPYPNSTNEQGAAHLFQREAQAIAHLDHPHILPLFGYGEEQINGVTLTYIVMPYREEGSLTTWLHQRGSSTPLSPHVIAHIVAQAAEALQYAHNHQVVHQDVKPSNFLIRSQDSANAQYPDLLLTDFGIAKMSTATSRTSHTVRGTVTYMAPEQWSGNSLPASDQYALAVMTYELLTGRPPFQGRPEQMMYLHLNTEPPPPSSFQPLLGRDVDAVLLTALSKRPEARFMAISAFAYAFSQTIAGLDASTFINVPRTSDIHATLAISKSEAWSGTHRTLTLPSGRHVNVTIPAQSYDGQVLRLAGLGEPSPPTGSAGSLILTLSVKATEDIAVALNNGTLKTMLASNPNVLANTIASNPNLISNTMASNPNLIPHTMRVPYPENVNHTQFMLPPAVETPLTPGSTLQPALKRKRSYTATFLLLGLALLIVASASLAAYYFGPYRRAIDNLHATATTNTNLSTAPASTVQAFNANATVTASANMNATTTANNAATATRVGSRTSAAAVASATAFAINNSIHATQTANAQQSNPYPPNTGTLAINDPLIDNSLGYGWDLSTGPGNCSFTGGTYHVRESKAKWYMDCNPKAAPPFSNFAFQVQMSILSGDQGGIMFRQQDDNHFYLFRIAQDSSYELDYYVDNTNTNATELQNGTAQSFHSGYGQINTLAVVADGSNISIYINTTNIISLTDSTYSSGHVGVLADANAGDSTEVVYSNAELWTF